MLFCPTCANILLIGHDDSGRNEWVCPTCPYHFPITKQITKRTQLRRKEVDDVMGGEDSWKNVDSTDTPCPKCENPRAFFMQLQIRSADEPMTTFYRCTDAKCANQWKEG
ncbi:putative Rpc11-DNA-directed RNA polymerase III subunit C11 [Microstroma glucosiphilum]|uniref:DNA-directed RNA polymerase subunit n=1 Tax=Pseudomicrostroma glucosiphilum TaxID=1684307 RepID=A0A316U707_9BASI|nr:putative Rpc11-DNA-directed RNA polymerase III subunit C11 [Pseudomicrostroma glucosiphilum]PWN20624.1 putative Rpc11-DNA-directed RNA polymerase III subunit C11 [Pseudomicrostroma glucosiphilum]